MSVYFGEISLSGHLRPVSQATSRLKEASKLGFERATFANGSEKIPDSGIRINTVSSLADLVADIVSGAADTLQEPSDTGKE